MTDSLNEACEGWLIFFELLDELTGYGEIIKILNIYSEEEDYFEDVSEDDTIGFVLQEMVIKSCEKVLVQFADFIDVGKKGIRLCFIQNFGRYQSHFEIGDDEAKIPNIVLFCFDELLYNFPPSHNFLSDWFQFYACSTCS